MHVSEIVRQRAPARPTKTSSPAGRAAGMMLKPSAAPVSNHWPIVAATCSGVPANVRCPRPPPSLPISCRTVRFSRCARSAISWQRLCAPSTAAAA